MDSWLEKLLKKRNKFEFSKHALEQMESRGIDREEVEQILNHPEQTKTEEGLKVFQSLTKDKEHLIRIFVNEGKNPNLIVTVYKTSKIKKYYEGKI
jgi:hypothetical protein